jgi:hypothetical protein
MKKLDKNKIIGYQLENDWYSGYSVSSFTVYDYIWWYNHNSGKRPDTNMNWKRELILVSEEVYEDFIEVQSIYRSCQEELDRIYGQFKDSYK